MAQSRSAQERTWADPRWQGKVGKVHATSAPHVAPDDEGRGVWSFRNGRTAKPAKLRLTPQQWDETAKLAKGGDHRSLKVL